MSESSETDGGDPVSFASPETATLLAASLANDTQPNAQQSAPDTASIAATSSDEQSGSATASDSAAAAAAPPIATSASSSTDPSPADSSNPSSAGLLPSSVDSSGGGGNGAVEPPAKRRKRKSLWDQPAAATTSGADNHTTQTDSTGLPPLTLSAHATPPIPTVLAALPPSNPLLAALQAQLALLPHLRGLASPVSVTGGGHHLAASHALSSPTTASRLDRRIYVGSLAYDVNEDTLRIIFEPFGPVVKVDMPKEPGHVPVRSKGFAFVEFEQPESARAALQTMDGMPLKGRPMKVNTPTGGPNAQSSLLSQLLQQQGGQGLAALQGQQLNSATLAAIQAAQIASGGTITGLPASFAAAAINGAAGPMTAPAFTLPAHLTSPASSTASLSGVPSVYDRMPGTIVGSAAKTRIYVGSLMWQLTEEQVRAIFEPFGAIRSCQLIINPETGKHRGYGFIEFADEKSAADAIKEMDGFDLVGRKLKVRYASALVAPQAAHQAHQHNQHNMQQQLSAAAQLPPGFIVPTLPAALQSSASPSFHSTQLSLSTEDNMRISSAEQRVTVMQKLSASSRHSPVLLLRNLLSPNEVDADLDGEVREECSKFGRVRDVRVVVADDEVRCYVLFDSAAECSRAVDALHGRWFGKRTVAADFYPLSQYEQGIFTTSAG